MDQAFPLILIVEDDEHFCHLLKFILERHGYRTLIAKDGLAAGKIFDNHSERPDLIFLDIMLPYIDGFDVLRIIRSHKEYRRIPVVMLTSRTTEQDIVRALDLGANDYISKPFQPNELVARVRRFLLETV